MRLLAIETSCDETAAAVVAETGDPARPWAIRSNVVASQVGDPPRVGRRRARAGLAPARPRHLRRRRGARSSGRRRRSAMSARSPSRRGPGWSARCSSACRSPSRCAWSRGLPLVPVHHLAGHIESLVLAHGALPLPAVVLVVSGGHTSLYRRAAPGRVPAGRADARRCGGGGVRQGGEAAGPGVSGRSRRSIAAPREGNDRAFAFPRCPPDPPRSQRAAGHDAKGCCPPTSRAGSTSASAA